MEDSRVDARFSCSVTEQTPVPEIQESPVPVIPQTPGICKELQPCTRDGQSLAVLVTGTHSEPSSPGSLTDIAVGGSTTTFNKDSSH